MDDKRQAVGEQERESSIQLDELPDELLIRVFCFAGAEDVTACAAVCRRWRALTHEPTIWRSMCHREYGCSAEHPSLSWADHYKQVRLCFAEGCHKNDSGHMVASIIRQMRMMQADGRNALSVLEHAEEASLGVVTKKVGTAEDTALHIAADRGFVEAVQWLLAHTADVNAASADGNRPIHYAARRGHLTTAKLLLDAGGDADCANQLGATPLFGAVVVGDLELMEMLVAHGANVNSANNLGETPLFIATWIGPLRSLEWLLQHGANANLADHSGISPLHKACLLGDVASVRLLLEYGADVEQVTVSGRRAVHFVSASGNCEILHLLLQHGASIRIRDRAGNTPLHVAAGKGRLEMVRALVAAGADCTARNIDRYTPAEQAWMRSEVATAAWLNGKDPSARVMTRFPRSPCTLRPLIPAVSAV
eukprot:jgi/Chlat1/2648/Chrsp178S02488